MIDVREQVARAFAETPGDALPNGLNTRISMLSCEFRAAMIWSMSLKFRSSTSMRTLYSAIRRVKRRAEQQLARVVLIRDVVLLSSVLVAARASAMRPQPSVPVGSRRTPDSSGCAASFGSRAERKGVSAVAESAWVAGRSNAVAGGRVAQALSASAVRARRRRERSRATAVQGGGFVPGGVAPMKPVLFACALCA